MDNNAAFYFKDVSSNPPPPPPPTHITTTTTTTSVAPQKISRGTHTPSYPHDPPPRLLPPCSASSSPLHLHITAGSCGVFRRSPCANHLPQAEAQAPDTSTSLSFPTAPSPPEPTSSTTAGANRGSTRTCRRDFPPVLGGALATKAVHIHYCRRQSRKHMPHRQPLPPVPGVAPSPPELPPPPAQAQRLSFTSSGGGVLGTGQPATTAGRSPPTALFFRSGEHK
jgi:hypothetical protein